jgi:hypothetical protein
MPGGSCNCSRRSGPGSCGGGAEGDPPARARRGGRPRAPAGEIDGIRVLPAAVVLLRLAGAGR